MKQALFFAISLLLFNCHSKLESETNIQEKTDLLFQKMKEGWIVCKLKMKKKDWLQFSLLRDLTLFILLAEFTF